MAAWGNLPLTKATSIRRQNFYRTGQKKEARTSDLVRAPFLLRRVLWIQTCCQG